MHGMYSMRSPAVKRLMKEAQELREPTEQYECHPLEDNLFEWHFTIRGPADSEFDGGLYHGRIILPPEYPMKPPSIIILTHNGRFEINKKICLSISGHHPESWQPSWSLRTALLAIIGFMPTHGAGALGSLDYSAEERKRLAKKSQEFKCSSCGCINDTLKPVTEESKKTTEEARELAAQISFKDEKEKNAALKSSSTETPAETDISQQDVVDEAGASSTPTTQTNMQQQFTPPSFTLPPPFGQFPFRMPFPPPFPPQMNMAAMQQQGSGTGAAQVPRFPLPFVSPMYPNMPPMMMPNGGFPFVPPMMPGMPLPQWPQQNMMTSQQQVMTSSQQSPSSSSPGESSSLNTRETTSQEENITPIPSPADTEDIMETDNSTEAQNDTIEAETIPSQERSQEGVRQRNITRPTTIDATSVQREARSAVLPVHTGSRSGDLALLAFAMFVLAVIFMLILRRLHMMNMFPSIL